MRTIVRWENPPEQGRSSGGGGGGRYDWRHIGKALKDRPQRWALVAVCPSSSGAGTTASNVRLGGYVGLVYIGGVFEAVSRTVDGEHRVYARWVGES